MTPRLRLCIYCKEGCERSKGVEHVIPQSFGTFGSATPTLDCVCDACNSHFGEQLDQLLARETIEGLTRYRMGMRSSEVRRQRRLSITLSGEEAGGFSGARMHVDGTQDKLLPPAAQFLICNFATGEEEVYFAPDIGGLVLPEHIYGKPGHDGVKGTWKCRVLASSKDDHDDIVVRLRQAGIPFHPGEPLQIASAAASRNQVLTFPVEIAWEVDVPHRRALAKILMNFAARYLGPDEVLTPRWDFLRRFVRDGKRDVRWRISEKPFWPGKAAAPDHVPCDTINIRVGNLAGNIVGAIQFYGHPTYEMILVEGSSLAAPNEVAYRFSAGHVPVRMPEQRTS